MGTTTADAGPMQIVLVLQGGGALGAYQVGAFRALAEHGLQPDWVTGISIGAINGAIIAGNAPEARADRLDAFWEAISWPELPWQMPTRAFVAASSAEAMLFGQPNFFRPRLISPLALGRAATDRVSFYDTGPLLETLPNFVTFARINEADSIRLSLGATDVAAGNLVFFDNRTRRIGPEHVLASGSLPPGFAATKIDGRYYWDGACVANTPLDAVTDEPDPPHRVVFMIDLFNAAGALPETIYEVAWREKEILYATRTAHHVAAVADKVNLRHARRLLDAPDAPGGRLDIVHIIYRYGENEGTSADAEFSRSSIAIRRDAGYWDMQAAIAARPWCQEAPKHVGALVHKVQQGRVETTALDGTG